MDITTTIHDDSHRRLAQAQFSFAAETLILPVRQNTNKKKHRHRIHSPRHDRRHPCPIGANSPSVVATRRRAPPDDMAHVTQRVAPHAAPAVAASKTTTRATRTTTTTKRRAIARRAIRDDADGADAQGARDDATKASAKAIAVIVATGVFASAAHAYDQAVR